jgi:hypothetical protein
VGLFIAYLSTLFSNLDHTAPNEKAIMNWKICGKKRSWPNLRYYPGIRLKGLSKAMSNISHNSRFPGRVLNPRSPEYEAGL